ncbi:MAG: sulfite exporter TauE/SafE family protein [Bacteroidia bacterium]
MTLTFSFILLLFIIAFMYSSVGHGGASGYLALMAFFSFTPEVMRPTALLLNIVVSLIAFVQYYRGGYFKWRLFYPFAIASIPMAYVGGFITIDAGLYKKILAVFLLFSVIRLLGAKPPPTPPKEGSCTHRNLPPFGGIRGGLLIALLIGAAIGLFSGMIGIGGGIILSPLVLLLGWADMKQSAAVSALFIFVNSLAGLAGLFTKGFEYKTEMGFMILIALIGGLAGSYFGAKKFKSTLLSKLLALVLLIATYKLVME